MTTIFTRPFQRIEIEICTHCDMRCFSCDRFLDVAPTTPMTVAQIQHFVDESIELDWRWERIHILGGEPTMHPQLHEIVEILIQYRNKYPFCLLRVISNGMGHLAKERSWLEGKKITINVESKKKGNTPTWFRNIRVAPVDEDKVCEELPPCPIYGYGTDCCGLGLTKHGYFLCGAGASIVRMLGYGIGVMHLKDVSPATMEEQARLLCRVCGHWNPKDGSPLRENYVKNIGEGVGAFWTKAIEDYKRNPPTLPLYGAIE